MTFVPTCLMVLLAVPMVGCSDGGSPRPVGQAAVSDSTPKVALASELMGQLDDRALHEYRERFVAGCVKVDDFSYAPRAFNPAEHFGLGLASSAEERRQRGFGVGSVESPSVGATDPNAASIERLPATRRGEVVAAIDHCFDEADHEIARRLEMVREALTPQDRAFIGDAIDDIDGRGARAVANWASCMAERGWSFEDPASMLEALELDQAELERGDGDGILVRREREIAIDDLGCAERWLAPLEGEVISELSDRLGDRYGVSSVFDEPFDLDVP